VIAVVAPTTISRYVPITVAASSHVKSLWLSTSGNDGVVRADECVTNACLLLYASTADTYAARFVGVALQKVSTYLTPFP